MINAIQGNSLLTCAGKALRTASISAGSFVGLRRSNRTWLWVGGLVMRLVVLVMWMRMILLIDEQSRVINTSSFELLQDDSMNSQ